MGTRCNRNKEDGYEDKGRGQVKLVRKTLQVMDSKGRSSEGFAERRDRSTSNRNATSVLRNIATSALSGEVLLGYMRKGSGGKCCACIKMYTPKRV